MTEHDEREAIVCLIMDIREHTYSRSHAGGFDFDLNMERAVERIREFIARREPSMAERYCIEMQLYGQFAAIRANRYREAGVLSQATRAQEEACTHYRQARRRLALICGFDP